MPTSEFDVGHIRLARETDLIVVAPATADLMAKMAGGHADDLASAVLLATDRPVLIAPAMNPRMWSTRRRGAIWRSSPRMASRSSGRTPARWRSAARPASGAWPSRWKSSRRPRRLLADARERPLAGKRVLVTSGPTHEPIDPVRYIANRSSGKQGHAIAAAAAAAGAEVTLVSGPVNVPDPAGVTVVKVETAREMLDAVEQALPADVAMFAAAVADWRVEQAEREKIKKTGRRRAELALVENPDILATVAQRKAGRPRLVIGFAAETENVIEHAQAKLARKGCDWIVANDVSPETGVMGGDRNTVHLVTADGVEDWPSQSKDEVARGAGRADRRRAERERRDDASSFASCGCRTAPACRCRPIRASTPPAST